MSELFSAPFANNLTVTPWFVLVRLLVAVAMGGMIAWIFHRTDTGGDRGMSFPTSTLVLLCVLVAMVTQVIRWTTWHALIQPGGRTLRLCASGRDGTGIPRIRRS